MKKWLLIVFGALAGLIAVVYVIGMLLPQDHRAAVTFDVGRSPEEVWQYITEIDTPLQVIVQRRRTIT